MPKYSTHEDDRPSFQFYPKDWMTDTGLMQCEPEDKGVWMDLLCLMFFSPIRGALLNPDGTKMDSKTIAKLLSTPEKVIANTISKLIAKRVARRLEDGTIISWRMYAKDKDLSQKRREAGIRGLVKRWHSNPDSKPIASGIANDSKHSSSEKEEEIEVVNEVEVFKKLVFDVVGYLNEKTGSKFPPKADKTQELIRILWKKGYTLEQFREVIDIKTKDWKGDPKMEQYLRPSTLFRKSKFEEYIGQAPKGKTMLETLKEIAEGNDGAERSGRIIDADSHDIP